MPRRGLFLFPHTPPHPTTTMKHLLLLYCVLSLASLLPISCSKGEQEKRETEQEGSANANANDTSIEPALGRLEFPRVKGGTSKVIIHSLDDRYGVNYSLEWDTEKRTQRWSCYQMFASNRESNTRRYEGNPQYPFDPSPGVNYFSYDPYSRWNGMWYDVTVGGVFYRSVRDSMYDHGHICPSADRLYSADANKQTFYLTNMQPMKNIFNAGIWGKMEGKLREWITLKSPAADTLYVCKGGTIDPTEAIPAPLWRVLDTGLPVPRYYFMALLRKSASGYKALGFFVEHLNEDHTSDDLRQYVVNISELERLTGIDFFCNLPDDLERKVESFPVDQVKKAWGM